MNGGLAWKPARAAGLQGDPQALAVHPGNAITVAVANGVQGVSAFFDLDGKHLWYGAFDGQARLARVPVGGGKAQAVELPALGRDAVAYIAQNPAVRTEYAIATFERGVYLSKDSGRSWTPLAVRGNGD